MSAEPIEIEEIASRAPPLPRREFGPRARVVWSIPVYALLLPLAKLLELVGWWPKLMALGMRRMMNDFAGYAPSAHDVLVCSYFKTGTNWTMQMVAQIAHRGRAEFDHVHDLVPWLELPEAYGYAVPVSDERAWRNAPTGLRAIKTHLPFSRLTYSPHARYVWVVRDPKDVFVSSYHFMRSTVLGPLMPTVPRWLDLFLSEHAYTGSWAEHVDGGWRRRHEDNVLFLTYEGMKADLRGTVERIAAFMFVDLTPAELENVVRRSSYEFMKAVGHKFDTRGLSPPWAAPRGAMVRRGERGSAAELLSPADQQRIDAYWRAELAKRGSDFPYDEMFATFS
jgi:hypothetical protein